MKKYDFIIVGAGILGLTISLKLKQKFKEASICILEKEEKIGLHASGRNSGVLHSGVYYGSDTLKAQLCAKGAAAMREFADEYKIPCVHSGKVIIASNEKDLPVIERLYENAANNNLNIVKINEKEVLEIEPYARPYECGLYSPDTSVIDSKGVLNKLRQILTQMGVELHFGQQVMDIDSGKNTLVTRRAGYKFGYLFNCAGAYSDKIAGMFGLAKNYALLPFKGIYYKLRPDKDYLVNASIYPTPDISMPFLGVHLTRTASGDVYVGPTAIPAFGRENYGFLKGIELSEGVSTAWELTRIYLNNNSIRQLVHHEVQKYLKRYFVVEVRRLVPDVMPDDLVTSSKVGIRPQLINTKSKKLEMDFVVESTDSSMHVLNAISPAFTSSFAFADMLLERYELAH